MKDFLIYIAQVSLMILISYTIYKVMLSRDTFHRVQRFFLLFLVVASFALPVCKITILKEALPENPISETETNIVNPSGELLEANGLFMEEESSPNWTFIVAIVYFTGIVVFLGYTFIGVCRVKALMKKANNRIICNGVEVLLMPENIPAFSFGDKIVMSQSDYNRNSEMIIRHELAHIKQRHSVDLFVFNLVLSLQWFNCFMWLMRRELLLVHEFSADQSVLQSGIDAKKYQYLLISKSACSDDLIPVANHFRSSDLRKRIKTMKKRSSKLTLLKLLIILPLVSIALVAFAETRYTTSQTEVIPEKEPFHMPYQGRIVARYGKMIDPINKRERTHKGVDIKVTNDTVRAPYSGIVKYADSPKNGYGNTLVITHQNDMETTYAHLAKFLVTKGTAVKGGDPIAIVGSTGRSTGKHLHLECRVNDELVDPESALLLNK